MESPSFPNWLRPWAYCENEKLGFRVGQTDISVPLFFDCQEFFLGGRGLAMDLATGYVPAKKKKKRKLTLSHCSVREASLRRWHWRTGLGAEWGMDADGSPIQSIECWKRSENFYKMLINTHGKKDCCNKKIFPKKSKGLKKVSQWWKMATGGRKQ